jgi:hypothetical protein
MIAIAFLFVRLLYAGLHDPLVSARSVTAADRRARQAAT